MWNCSVKSTQGFLLLVQYMYSTSEEICSSKINVSKERKSAKYCNACYALEAPGCHRLLTFILG